MLRRNTKQGRRLKNVAGNGDDGEGLPHGGELCVKTLKRGGASHVGIGGKSIPDSK